MAAGTSRRRAAADLVLDGGFNHHGAGRMAQDEPRRGSSSDRPDPASYCTGPYEGYGFAVTRSSAQGGGIYQDIPFPVSAGESFCADAEVVTAGAHSGARGTLSLWLLGELGEPVRQGSRSGRCGARTAGARSRRA